MTSLETIALMRAEEQDASGSWRIETDSDRKKRLRRYPAPAPRVRKPKPGVRYCEVPGCDHRARARGMCVAHHKRWKRGLPVEAPIRRRQSGKHLPNPKAFSKRRLLTYLRLLASEAERRGYRTAELNERIGKERAA